jgi:hypothetical protein
MQHNNTISAIQEHDKCQGYHTGRPEAFWRAHRAGGPIHYALYEPGGVLYTEKLLFQIYFTAITFHIVASQHGGRQSEVAIHATVLGTNGNNCGHMRERAWAQTCRVRTCTGRQHVPDANMSGANLTFFFSKHTSKLPFLAEEAQMNLFYFIFCTFNCRILPLTTTRTCAKKIRKI